MPASELPGARPPGLWRAPLSAADTPTRGVAIAAAAVLFVLIVGGLTWVNAATRTSPPFRVSVESFRTPNGGLAANFTFTNGPSTLGVQAGLVPGTTAPPSDPTLFVFADPAFDPRYGSENDVQGVATRLHAYLALTGSDVHVAVVDGPGLYSALEGHQGAMLAIVGTGIVPDAVFSNWSSLLPNWVREGGTLFWAGGPIGYESGHAIAGGFVHSDLYWLGQRSFFGFDLVDPATVTRSPATAGAIPAGFLGSPTDYSDALGLSYPGTPEGANTTIVRLHGGVAMGFESPGTGGASPQTSLAYLPEGAGSVFYFGGAMAEPGVGYVPGGAVDIAEDIATIVSSALVPESGNVVFAPLTLAPFETETVRFALSYAPIGYVAVVHASVDGSHFVFWSAALPGGGPGVAGTTSGSADRSPPAARSVRDEPLRR